MLGCVSWSGWNGLEEGDVSACGLEVDRISKTDRWGRIVAGSEFVKMRDRLTEDTTVCSHLNVSERVRARCSLAAGNEFDVL